MIQFWREWEKERERQRNRKWQLRLHTSHPHLPSRPCPPSPPELGVSHRPDVCEDRVCLKNQQVLWTSLFWLDKGWPFIARPPKAKEEQRNQNLGKGAQSCAWKKTKTKIITISEGNLKLPIKQTDPEPSASLTSASFKAITEFSKP